MTAPVRPIFKNGQRLTAERLTEIVEYLREWIRRFSLGPMSAGVAAGLELSPAETQSGDIVVQPGLAIDGRGRLLVLEAEQRFTRAEIEARVGVLSPGQAARISLVLDDLGQSANLCNPQVPLRVVENVDIVFTRDVFVDNVNAPSSLSQPVNCVNPWEDLDQGTGGGCGVTIGHALLNSSGALTASRRFRQGVSPQFGVIRDSSGEAAVALGEMNLDLGIESVVPYTPSVVPAVAVEKPALFTRDARFTGITRVNRLVGDVVQATRVAPLGAQYTTGGYWGPDPRVFVFSAGRGDAEVPNGFGGLAAVTCRLDTAAGFVDGPGQPLFMASVTDGNQVKVTRTGGSSALLGLSAAQNFVLPGTGEVNVPIAVAGLVSVTVDHTIAFGVGTELTAGTTGRLVVATAGSFVIARAAQSSTVTGPSSTIYAWVVHPAVKFF